MCKCGNCEDESVHPVVVAMLKGLNGSSSPELLRLWFRRLEDGDIEKITSFYT
jgi:hypothetical protein